ncbi:MAG TPA: amino acid ABC transporter permease [Hyphomicrobiaceae bacterium]|nr:amino acid ABC transporter permease [Hyphomicrobiaceae bacterium]
MAVTGIAARAPRRTPSLLDLLYRPEVRQVLFQIVLLVALAALFWMIISNTAANLRRQNIASGFGFWNTTAGFDISQTLIPYTNTSTYGRVFWVGLTNTLLVAAIGVVFATIVGFMMGIARLSTNWLIARLATVYVETIRNIPLLLQLFVWYFAVLKNLPPPRQSLELMGVVLNLRGLYLPEPLPQAGFEVPLAVLALGVLASIGIAIWARRRQRLTGAQFHTGLAAFALIVLAPVATFFLAGAPLEFEYPTLRGFNYTGGIVVLPELLALLLGLVIYTGAFIAEIVRAGIQGVPKGQKEAANAIGLSAGQTLRLVVIPQAMRIIIPPLTSNYLNLIKNSSLAVAIAYPDLVSVFAGTVLNQTGQAVEVILITMLVYLSLSLFTSLLMNWFNARMALVER